jgi:hypothetical protein
VAGPVLRELGLSTASAAPATRLWWCCPGPLGLLPLAAASARPTLGRSPDAVLDRVVSSWTPSLAALLPGPEPAAAEPAPARRGRWPRRGGPGRDPGREAGSGLLVAATGPDPGAAADRHRAEDALARAVPRLLRLTGSEADAGAVEAAAGSHQVVHLAGPVRYRPADADGGVLVLAGPGLPVRRLAGTGRLFLAACEPDGAADPADFHLLPGDAALLAGFRQVVAPVWAVGAGPAARVAVLVYERLGQGGSSAAAVHEAARRERARHPDRPELWAAFRHLGR